MIVQIILTSPLTNAGPFNIYSDVDGFYAPFAFNVTKSQLESGYVTTAPDNTTIVKMVSVGECTNSINLRISERCSSGIDLVILIDYTSSMGVRIDDIKANVGLIVDEVATLSNGNYRLALGIFDEHDTNNYDTVIRYFNSLHYQVIPPDQKYTSSSITPTGSTLTQYITFLEKFGSIGDSTAFKSSLNLLNSSSYFNSTVIDIAILSDDSFLAVGNFTSVLGKSSNRFIRILPNYRPDLNFDIGLGFNSTVNRIVIQPDGKILIGGTFTSFNGVSINRFIRLNSDYTIDLQFTNNLGTGFNNSINYITVQPDGKIIVVGTFTSFNGVSKNRIIRLEADGTSDTTFNTNTGSGFVGIQNSVETVTIQPDGAILVGGSFNLFNGTSANRIVRLNSDGTRDTTFVIGVGFSNFSDRVRRILIQGTDVICFGTLSTYNGTPTQNIIKLNSLGGVVQAFPSPTGFNNAVNYANFATDGKIVVTGAFTSFNSNPALNIVRLNSDLTYDPSFVNTFSSQLYKFEFMSSGNIISSGGNSTNGNISYFDSVSNLTSVKNFSIGTGAYDAEPSGLSLERVINFNAVGTFRENVSKVVMIITDNPSSYESDTYDQSAYEKVRSFIPKLTENAFRVTLLNSPLYISADSITEISGKIYISGYRLGIITDHALNLLQDPIYTLDSIYGKWGSYIYKSKPSNDDKLLAVGEIGVLNRTGSRFMVKFNQDFTVDSSFTFPEISSSIGYSSNIVEFAYLQSDKILIGGSYFDTIGTHTTNSLALINLDGTVDISFVSKFARESSIDNIHIKNNGNIVFTGYFLEYDSQSVAHIIEVLPDFSINSAFVTTGFNTYCTNTVMQSDEKIVCTGRFTTYDGIFSQYLVRVNTDGSIDSSYVTGTGLSQRPYNIAIQSDDKCILIFSSTSAKTYNDIPITNIVRINTDGTIDTTFNADITNGGIYSIKVLSDGKIAIGGEFTLYGSTPVNKLAVLNPDGSLYSSSTFTLNDTYRDSLRDLVNATNGVVVNGYNGVDVINSMNLFCNS